MLPIIPIGQQVELECDFLKPLGYYWVAAKLLLTSVTLIVLLLQMNAIAELSAIAATRTVTDAELGLRMRMIIHAGGGLGVLLLIMILSLWKPKGVTPFGQHQAAQ